MQSLTSFFVLAGFVASSALAMEYRIMTTWDNRTIDHVDKPVIIQLLRNDASSFKISVDAPFFKDPAPPGQAGEPYYGLWDFEVVEVFFLNDDDQYVEIELCPWGQHIVLLLSGYRKTIRHSLFINFTANRLTGKWQGEAIIPADLLPPNVTKMNAYAIHGVSDTRVYESLYPVPYNSANGADFHKLDAFQPFDRSIILTEDVDTLSQIWKNSFEGIRSLRIEHTWNGVPLEDKDAIDLQIETRSGTGLIITVTAPFYDDVSPSSPSGWPYSSLSSYEVVHLFFRSDVNDRYLEIELGPWGHYLVVFWTGYKSNVSDWHDEIIYQTERKNDGSWKGTALIPLAYLPPMISKCNAHSAHGPEEVQRKINSLYPTQSNVNQPDFHQKNNYKAIDMSMIYPNNENVLCSDIWKERDSSCQPIIISGGNKQTLSPLLLVITTALLIPTLFFMV